ncbi:hypothetical protein B0T18DRAFT_410143 [Schizothecium vesticola]|uniref:SPRY domain-containing protein n=1 Tax=Schizothecium vesticola TaxID=314040 RepID=A0AA40EUI0_9PEZI|nr:hypothetical protein B0T18DRAFT_410143 [Schizothecium vesticola]
MLLPLCLFWGNRVKTTRKTDRHLNNEQTAQLNLASGKAKSPTFSLPHRHRFLSLDPKQPIGIPRNWSTCPSRHLTAAPKPSATMCFGSKERRLVDDDEAPRPANGQFPHQPTYANPSPKSSVPAFHQNQNQNHQAPQQQQYQPQQQPYQPQPVSPLSPIAGPTSYQQQPSISYPQQYVPAPTMAPPAELPAVKQSNPPVELSSDYAPPPGPPPQQATGSRSSDYAPPPGPPPQHATASDYAPPPGPPPSSKPNPYDDDYAPPSGPPPNPYDNNYAPPPGPPPTSKQQHDWESAVPDTSLFPPPPPLFNGYYRSPTSNATEAEAEAGEAWCHQFPLSPPLDIDTSRTPEVQLMAPTVNFKGTLTRVAPGVWDGATTKDCLDSTVIGYPPLYVVKRDSPLAASGEKKKKTTVYYEVKVKQPAKGGGKDVCLALGFTALPYPGFRMPGWHRGSVAVHGDDGHKYVNDRWGGKGFTEAFKVGETVGVGMTFWVGGAGGVETEVFLTRGGREVGRWDLHEESDAVEDGPVTGLEGYHDLSCAVGAYQATAFEVVFDPARWLFKPEQ